MRQARLGATHHRGRAPTSATPGRTASPGRAPDLGQAVANLITVAGADRVLTMDLHAGQIQGFFDIPVDNLYASPLMAADLKERYPDDDLIIVSPDVGGVGARRYCQTA